MKTLLKSKLKASGIHLLASGVLFLIGLYFIVYKWYPGPTFAVDGGWQGVRIMVFVDLVLGPLLTLVVFNPNKTRAKLIFNLAFIALVQLAAFGWGLFVVHDKHPMALSYSDGALYSVSAKTLIAQGATGYDLEQMSSNRPATVFVTNKAATQGLADAISGTPTGPTFLLSPEEFKFYRPLRDYMTKVKSEQQPTLDRLLQTPATKLELDALITKHNASITDFVYCTLHANFGDIVVVLDKEANIIAALPSTLEEPKDN